MRSDKNILIAFVLNLAFSIFEFFGGILIGSIAILSDAVHDLGDAASIGISYFLEKKSKKKPDEAYTYGYVRYSVIGSAITTLILLIGSVMVIYHSILRIVQPTVIHYDSMILFAVVGVCVNLCAAFFTHKGSSLNQKAVNLHMIEDVLGWIVVLIGAVVMRFTDLAIIDPILSIGVSVFILIHAVRNLKEVVDLFLKKTPHGVNVSEIKEHLCEIEGILDVHHIHLWSLDGLSNCATMHIVTNADTHTIKEKVREELREHGIEHVTLELETEGEPCHDPCCIIESKPSSCHHHHHHH